MSSVLRWETPPDRPTDKWNAVADELKKRQGEWAVVAEDEKNNTLARNIKAATYKSFAPAGDFDTRSVKTGDTFTIFARFTNGDSSIPAGATAKTTRTRTTRGKTTAKTTRTKGTTAPKVNEEVQDAVDAA